MAGRVDRRLERRIIAFALLYQRCAFEESFPGQASLAERRAARGAAAEAE